MFVDARNLPDGTELEAEICIIGAGAAGITIAREMIGLPLKVIVLESGGLSLDLDNQRLYQGENIGLPYSDLHTIRSRYFGGSTNCWGGWCRPFDPIDFEARDWVPHSGWPFGKETLDPFYDRAHTLCSVGPNTYDPDDWKDEMEERDLSLINVPEGRITSQISQLSKERRFGVAHGDDIKAADNIEVYLHANVQDIKAGHDAASIVGVDVATTAKNRFNVSAKKFVLASGGLENPRLLLASNGVQKAGLGNQNDLVGRFFMEHPRLETGTVEFNGAATSTNLYDVQYTFFHSPIAANIALSEETQRTEKTLNYKAWILSVYKGEESKGAEALKSVYRAMRKTTLPDQFVDTSPGFWLNNIGTMIADFPNTASVVIGRLSKHQGMIEKRQMANLCEPMPDPESRVTLGPTKDQFGMNRIQLKWRLNQLDKYTMRRGQEIFNEELTKSGRGRVTGPMVDDSNNEWPSNLLIGWHHMGTTRMHDDPKRGVVDANCRVHGIENLYVGGSSVFTTGGSDLPTMTIVALALRLSDHLKDRLNLPMPSGSA